MFTAPYNNGEQVSTRTLNYIQLSSKVVAAKSLYKPAAKVAHKSRTCKKCAMESPQKERVK